MCPAISSSLWIHHVETDLRSDRSNILRNTISNTNTAKHQYDAPRRVSLQSLRKIKIAISYLASSRRSTARIIRSHKMDNYSSATRNTSPSNNNLIYSILHYRIQPQRSPLTIFIPLFLLRNYHYRIKKKKFLSLPAGKSPKTSFLLLQRLFFSMK